MASKNSIQVAIKVRPLLKKENEQACYWKVLDNSIQLNDSQSDPYYFDFIFDQNVNNEVIFDKMARHIVHSGIKGFNGTIFAYGQTSSGKTYTMIGNEYNPGVMVLAAKEIFKEIERASDRVFLLRVGCIEIYNEKIYDLLNKKNQDLKIYDSNTGTVNVNCEEIIITSEQDLLHFLCLGNKERTVGETNKNERSSRSHYIFRVIIESRKKDKTEDDAVIQSVLNLVDLAGSERADQTGARGTRLKEGGHINKSLLFLSNVIKQLSENEDDKYISYRDSKLTRILQASLGGNALTSIICTIKPTAIEETQSTLSFAMRAKIIKNKPQVNETVSEATMLKRLEKEIRHLKLRLAEERNKNQNHIYLGQLEKRINDEVLKIISFLPLSNFSSQNEKRRRTWCSATSKTEIFQNCTEIPQIPPQIQTRETGYTSEQNGDLRSLMANKDSESNSFLEKNHLNQRNEATAKILPVLEWNSSQTPNSIFRELGDINHLKIVERDLEELQEFTSLEKNFDVKYDINEALLLLTQRILLLERERLNHIELTEDLFQTKQLLSDSEKRCNHLQTALTELASYFEIGMTNAVPCEQKAIKLKTVIKSLQSQNRDPLSIEYELQTYKCKARLREKELLDLITEKEDDILKLKKNCDKNYGIVKDINLLLPDNIKFNDNFEKLNHICDKNIQSKQKLLNLKKKYAELQLEFEQMAAETFLMQANLNDLKTDQEKSQIEPGFCFKLFNEGEQKQINNIIDEIRVDLNNIQQNCDQLETIWHENFHSLNDLQSKLNMLHADSNEINCISHKDNNSFEIKINNLNTDISDLKALLLNNLKCLSEYTSKESRTLRDSFAENKNLKEDLCNVINQIDELRRENDTLSIQLMDSLNDAEYLKINNARLEKQIKKYQETGEKRDVSTQFCNDSYTKFHSELNVDVDDSEKHLKLIPVNIKELKSEKDLANLNQLQKNLMVNNEIQEGFDITTEMLKEEINELRNCNQLILTEKESLLESTAITISELREQIRTLSKELFEKSLFIENSPSQDKQYLMKHSSFSSETQTKMEFEVSCKCMANVKQKTPEKQTNSWRKDWNVQNESKSSKLGPDCKEISNLGIFENKDIIKY